MNTEKTKMGTAGKPLVIYDGECGLCAGNLKWLHRLDWLKVFDDTPFQAEELDRRFPAIKRADYEEALHVIFPDGRTFRGADAIRAVMVRMPLTALPGVLLGLPPLARLFRMIYPVIARNRYRLGGHCKIEGHPPAATTAGWTAWMPLVILATGAMTLQNRLPAWGFMGMLALAIFAGFKWWTWRRAGIHGGRALGYLFFWPGMDAAAFLGDRPAQPPRPAEWAAAAFKILAGGVLLWGAAKQVYPAHPILTGWIGMTGIILLLHFGLFHGAALFWLGKGVRVEPLMRTPLLAGSLSDFWGRRWNSAFRHLAHTLAFLPLRKRLGTTGALLAAFLLSGLVHELVISLPARDGYGLPTLYFLLQGAGIALEHSPAGKRAGLNRGAVGRAFGWLVAAGPAVLLFHPPFITQVILPGMRALGAL